MSWAFFMRASIVIQKKEYTDKRGYVFAPRDDGMWDVSIAGWAFKPIDKEKLPSDLKERNAVIQTACAVEDSQLYTKQDNAILGYGSMQHYKTIIEMSPGTVIKAGPETYVKRYDGDWNKYDDRLGRKLRRPQDSIDVSSSISHLSPLFIYKPIDQDRLVDLFCNLIATRDTDQIRKQAPRMIDLMPVGTVLRDSMELDYIKLEDGQWKVQPEYDEIWFGNAEDIVYQMTETQRCDDPDYSIRKLNKAKPIEHTKDSETHKRNDMSR